MGTPWAHWNADPLTVRRPAEEYHPHHHQRPASSSTRDRRELALHEIVKDYVEAVSNYESRFPEPVELDAIAQYARRTDLLTMIVQVLAERLTRAYPWNIKALDILEHLLLQTPTSLEPYHPLLPHLSHLYYNPSTPSDPDGTAPFVRSKADSCLVRLGHELDPIRGMAWRVDDLGYDRVGGFPGGFWGWKWGADEVARGQGHQRGGAVAGDGDRNTGWGSTVPQPGRLSNPSSTNFAELKPSSARSNTPHTPHAPAISVGGFSISTTTVSPGSPTLDHFRQHERSHAKLVEEAAEAERRKLAGSGSGWTRW